MAGVRRSPDVRRMAHAVSHPGIDPRIWGSWAIITEVGFDPEEGLFADIQLQPTGEVETVLITGIYAGNGFGCYRPIKKDDTVYILFPNGDPNNGGIVVARSWNASDLPPAQFKGAGDQDLIDFPLEVVEKDKPWQVITTGSGDAKIFSEHGVLIGDDNAAPVAKATGISDLQTAINGWTPVPNDGGAALKVALVNWLAVNYATTIGKMT